MKKNPVRRSYILPNAIVKEQTQIYQGDFFAITVAPIALSEFPTIPNFTRLRFRLTHLFFDLQVLNETFGDYETLKDSAALQNLTKHYSLATEEHIMAFFDAGLSGGLADRFLYARVVNLLVHLAREAGARLSQRSITESFIALAEQTHDRILADLSIFETVEQLARKAGTSKQILQSAFRARFGTTVGRFSRTTRLAHARHLLETTNETLLSIALSVGYNDPANFSTAFKTHFGHTPRTKMK